MQVVSTSRLKSDPSLAKTLEDLITGVEKKDPAKRFFPTEDACRADSVPRARKAEPRESHALERLESGTKNERSSMLSVYKERARKELEDRNMHKKAARPSPADIASSRQTSPAESAPSDGDVPYKSLPYIPLNSLLNMISESGSSSASPSRADDEVGEDGLTVSERGLLNSFSPTLTEAIRNAEIAVEDSRNDKLIHGEKVSPASEQEHSPAPVSKDGRPYDIVSTSHYLDLAGVPVQEYGVNFTLKGDERESGWACQRDIYGFDEREFWNLDSQFMQWIYCRCMFFLEYKMCSDVYVEFDGKVMSQRHALESICEDALFAIKNQFSKNESVIRMTAEREKRASRLWAEILPYMWYERG